MAPRRKSSRRGLLVAGVAGAVGLSGCIGGHAPFTRLEVDVSTSFASEPPVAVPVTVDARVQNVDSPNVALRDVELVAYDIDLNELATELLGDFDRAEADAANRIREEHGGQFTSTTVYGAEWDVETSIDVDAVPEWLTFRVGEAWFGEEATEEGSAPGGVVSASTPPPALSAYVRYYGGSRPPPETVEPDAFARERVESDRSVADPVLPRIPDRSGNESASDE